MSYSCNFVHGKAYYWFVYLGNLVGLTNYQYTTKITDEKRVLNNSNQSKTLKKICVLSNLIVSTLYIPHIYLCSASSAQE